MTKLILHIFDYIRGHRLAGWFPFLLLTVFLIFQITRLSYVEEISDFLPLSGNHQKAMRVWQDISGANRLFVIFQQEDSTQVDPDRLVEAVDAFAEIYQQRNLGINLITQIDMEKMDELTAFVYSHIPFFLTEEDYTRMDSLLAIPDYLHQQLQADKQMLLFPVGGLLTENIQRDPLSLFTSVVQQLQRSAGSMNYELYDGYIFSPDMSRAIAILNSPYGSSETENNSHLLQTLEEIADSVRESSAFAQADIRVIGGPAVAVANASQIKKDCLISVSLAVVLILLLLLLTFRKVRHILLIVLSIAWGWLFALGSLALVHDHISVIVIGISSVIIGIAVNYPLHLIAHLRHTASVRQTLREVIMPLVVGNITTVGAFLALVPLKSVALRDLGLFSSFLLLGTILFVILWLPHLVKAESLESQISDSQKQKTNSVLSRIGNVRLDNKRWVVVLVVLLTMVFAWFSQRTSFDSNMANINFMTDEQRADMAFFEKFLAEKDSSEQAVYVVSTDSTLDGALDYSLRLQSEYSKMQSRGEIRQSSGCTQFLISRQEQERRLQRWQQFAEQHGENLRRNLPAIAVAEGFSAGSFDEFFQLLDNEVSLMSGNPLMSTFASNLSLDSLRHSYSVVDVLTVKNEDVQRVEKQVNALGKGHFSFDVQSMNSAIASNLSDDFNYIGWACGLIVFFFLWFSLGSFELAALSFLPMAVSWVWILGIMGLLGIKFNIVNVILATFIFGQGDDYTIFMTEGCQYEYAYRRKMLSSYKQSIILSALIMFIGIGALILARHPALRSLAQVTIVGMSSVVLMAWLLPPLLFRWLTMKDGQYRKRPLSLSLLYRRLTRQVSKGGTRNLNFETDLVLDRYRYKGVETVVSVRHRLADKQMLEEAVSLAQQPEVVLRSEDHGEQALLIALLSPQTKVIVSLLDEERQLLLKYAAEGVAPNIVINGEGQNTESL